MKKKILGALVAACAGDAMGAVTEMRTREQIIKKYNGYVKEFLSPPDDVFAKGRKPGQVTDDFSMAYFLTESFIKSKGQINEKSVKEGLLNWAESEEYFEKFAGPTTKVALEYLKEGREYDVQEETGMVNYNSKATNGSAMKILPAGLFNPGDVEKAIEDAVKICKPTHNNNLSISGACAVAASVSKALEEKATLDDVIEAGIYGAEKGFDIGIELGKIAAGPSVSKRIKLAVEIGKNSQGFDDALKEIYDIIGCGIHVSEAVPAVYGLLAAFSGDTKECIYGGVNIGSDTDTVATMLGGIAGALNGVDSLPENYLRTLNKANGYKLEKMSEDIYNIVGINDER
ncbi:MAG: ADP-ribosylglycohydrolase family protein [Tissierellales bacterium]|jgi:ADP-ribosylglycohydrolase|nr:ADP-ribosylglycohydrolase family protein [Tissierellales bacterium]